MDTMKKMIRKNIHFTESQIERLRELSEKSGIGHAEIIRRLIDYYLSEIEKKILYDKST